MDKAKRRLASVLHIIARVSLIGFVIGFAGLILCLFVINKSDGPVVNVVGIGCLITTVASGLSHAISMLMRDFARSTHAQPRFSLRTLLIATTLVAVALGCAVYVVRK